MKMKLHLDDLQVESFAVTPELEGIGTVKGLMFDAELESGMHSQCYTHCATDCEGSCTCPSQARTHCAGDSCDGSCATAPTVVIGTDY